MFHRPRILEDSSGYGEYYDPTDLHTPTPSNNVINNPDVTPSLTPTLTGTIIDYTLNATAEYLCSCDCDSITLILGLVIGGLFLSTVLFGGSTFCYRHRLNRLRANPPTTRQAFEFIERPHPNDMPIELHAVDLSPKTSPPNPPSSPIDL